MLPWWWALRSVWWGGLPLGWITPLLGILARSLLFVNQILSLGCSGLELFVLSVCHHSLKTVWKFGTQLAAKRTLALRDILLRVLLLVTSCTHFLTTSVFIGWLHLLVSKRWSLGFLNRLSKLSSMSSRLSFLRGFSGAIWKNNFRLGGTFWRLNCTLFTRSGCWAKLLFSWCSSLVGLCCSCPLCSSQDWLNTANGK